MQGRNGRSDVEHGLVDTVGRDRVGQMEKVVAIMSFLTEIVFFSMVQS